MLDFAQISALSPDRKSIERARQSAEMSRWQDLGRSERALWGRCRGSRVYRVAFDRRDRESRCSCPSRKLPCRHALALLLIAAASPEALWPGEPPEWIEQWLASRDERKKSTSTSDAPVDRAAARKRALDRRRQMAGGLETLQLWMEDLVGEGLHQLPRRGYGFWEQQAARMVDAKVPGIGSWLRRLGEIVGAGDGWPERLLTELGRIALLVEAHRRIDLLPAELAATVERRLGWRIRKGEVLASGPRQRDQWQVVGCYREEDDNLSRRTTWLVGESSGRTAHVLDFAYGRATFEASWTVGQRFEAELAYYPGARPQRALVVERRELPPSGEAPAAAAAIHEFLEELSRTLAEQPFRRRLGCFLRAVAPVEHEGQWWLREESGAALPLGGSAPWALVAVSGGRPVSVFSEWSPAGLLPLSVWSGSRLLGLE